jgi:phage shock protein C
MRYYDRAETGLYRSRDGMIFGVCEGVGDYFDISANGIRLLLVIALICTGFFPMGLAYIVAALVMKKESYVRW